MVTRRHGATASLAPPGSAVLAHLSPCRFTDIFTDDSSDLLRRTGAEVHFFFGVRLGVREFLSDPTARGVADHAQNANAGIEFRDALVDGEREACLDEAFKFTRRPARPASRMRCS